MTREEIAALLGKAVGRHIGAPGTIHNFNQLTGGANKNTYSFEADIGDEQLHLILQIPGKPKEDEPNPLEGVMTRVTADQDARLMIAAHDSGVPAPKVRAILDDADGLDPGYITEFVSGETLATKILREDQFAKARPQMAAQCGKILAGIHNIDLKKVSFLGPRTRRRAHGIRWCTAISATEILSYAKTASISCSIGKSRTAAIPWRISAGYA